MISSRRNFLKSLFVAPAIVAVTNLMPVKAFAHLLEPQPRFKISPGVYTTEIDGTYRIPAPATPQEALERVMNNSLFEMNDTFTRTQVEMQMQSYMENFKQLGELSDYTVVCNDTNNNPWSIDNNQLHADIYIKPTRSIEYIRVTAIATSTGARFEEYIKA